jgi:hypothetical protein
MQSVSLAGCRGLRHGLRFALLLIAVPFVAVPFIAVPLVGCQPPQPNAIDSAAVVAVPAPPSLEVVRAGWAAEICAGTIDC